MEQISDAQTFAEAARSVCEERSCARQRAAGARTARKLRPERTSEQQSADPARTVRPDFTVSALPPCVCAVRAQGGSGAPPLADLLASRGPCAPPARLSAAGRSGFSAAGRASRAPPPCPGFKRAPPRRGIHHVQFLPRIRRGKCPVLIAVTLCAQHETRQKWGQSPAAGGGGTRLRAVDGARDRAANTAPPKTKMIGTQQTQQTVVAPCKYCTKPAELALLSLCPSFFSFASGTDHLSSSDFDIPRPERATDLDALGLSRNSGTKPGICDVSCVNVES
ncbi:hypothetical protein AOLI_G00027360 [Acnodon oligacanthus]